MSAAAADPLAAGQEALARAEWEKALDCFEDAAAATGSGAAWEGVSWALWWLGDTASTLGARERAYRAFRAAGDRCGAARAALWLANDALDFRGDAASASGWLERARRLLDGMAPCSEVGWLAVFDSYCAFVIDGDPVAGERLGREAARIGHELGVADVEAVGAALEGQGLVVRGQGEAGMRRLDEAAAIAAGEDFELAVSPGFVLCLLQATCERVGDFQRAARSAEAMRRRGERLRARHVIGVCRTTLGAVLTSRGEWPAAETELVAAVEDLTATRPGLAPNGLVRLGELRARQGRAEEARSLFERAGAAGLTGLGALALDAGDALHAAELAERALRRVNAADLANRLPALELLVRARAALGELEQATSAEAELARAAAELATPYLRGRARHVAGDLEAARAAGAGPEADRLAAARRAYEDAIDAFDLCAAPYDAALARASLARVLSRLGREDAARREAGAAREVLARLGAARDAARATAATGDAAALSDLSAREVEVLRLVAQGQSDKQIAAQLYLSPHTVHRHVANIRAKLRLPSRSAAVAYATRAGLL